MVLPLPKVLHPIGGRPMLAYLLRVANSASGPRAWASSSGHQEELLRKGSLRTNAQSRGWSGPVTFIRQEGADGSGPRSSEALPSPQENSGPPWSSAGTRPAHLRHPLPWINAHQGCQKGTLPDRQGPGCQRATGRVVRRPSGRGPAHRGGALSSPRRRPPSTRSTRPHLLRGPPCSWRRSRTSSPRGPRRSATSPIAWSSSGARRTGWPRTDSPRTTRGDRRTSTTASSSRGSAGRQPARPERLLFSGVERERTRRTPHRRGRGGRAGHLLSARGGPARAIKDRPPVPHRPPFAHRGLQIGSECSVAFSQVSGRQDTRPMLDRAFRPHPPRERHRSARQGREFQRGEGARVGRGSKVPL